MAGSPTLKTFLIYFIVALIVFLSAYGFSGENALSEAIPVLLSIVLLIPLYIWHRTCTDEEKLSKEITGRTRPEIVLWISILFILALSVRVPSVLLFGEPYEKTPLIYLLILTMVIIERTDVSAFGFKSKKIETSLLKGAILYLFFGGSVLSIEYLLVRAFTGQVIVKSFDILSFLFAMPFQTLCVGISEEGLFRGYIQTHLEKLSTFRKAILVQALLFGVWHFVWNLSPFNPLDMGIHVGATCFWGLLVGYFVGKSRSLVPVVFTHGLWNSVIHGMITNEAAIRALEKMPILNQISVELFPYIVSGMLTFAFIKCVLARN